VLLLVRARERADGEMALGEAAHRVAEHFLLFAQLEIHGLCFLLIEIATALSRGACALTAKAGVKPQMNTDEKRDCQHVSLSARKTQNSRLLELVRLF